MGRPKGGSDMWKGFDIAVIEDGTITWQGIGEALLSGRKVLLVSLAVTGLLLAAHFLL